MHMSTSNFKHDTFLFNTNNTPNLKGEHLFKCTELSLKGKE